MEPSEVLLASESLLTHAFYGLRCLESGRLLCVTEGSINGKLESTQTLNDLFTIALNYY